MILLSFLLLPLMTLAGGVNCPTGLVPCGTKDCPCKLCDLFQMFDRIVKFVLINLVPPIGVLMLIIGGVMFFMAAGNPAGLKKAQDLLKAVIFGLVIVYGAWLLINAFFLAVGVADWTGLKEGWFKYPPCL